MGKAKNLVKGPNNETQTRNKKTEQLSQIMFSNSGRGGDVDPDDEALNSNLPQYDAKKKLKYLLRSYKKGRLKQAITPLNVHSRLQMMLAYLYFHEGFFKNNALNQAREAQRIANRHEGLRRYEAANDIYRHRERHERNRAENATSHDEKRDEAKEHRQEPTPQREQQDPDQSTDPSGDMFSEIESDLQALANDPAATTDRLITIANRLEKNILESDLFRGDREQETGQAAAAADATASLVSDINDIDDDIPPWPGMTGGNADSPEWQASGSAWPFTGSAAYDLLPQHETGLDANQGRRELICSAIKTVAAFLAFGSFGGVMWSLSPGDDGDQQGDDSDHPEDGEFKEIVRNQRRHEQLLSQLPPATDEEWGTVEIDDDTEDEDDSESTTVPDSSDGAERPGEHIRTRVAFDSRIAQGKGRPSVPEGLGMEDGNRAINDEDEGESKKRRPRSAVQDWGRVETGSSIWRVRGDSIVLQALNQVLYIDNEPEGAWITVNMPLLARRTGKDNRYVNFLPLLQMGYTCVAQPPHYYDNGLRKSQRTDCYMDDEIAVTVQVRGERSAVDNTARHLQRMQANLVELQETLEQEQEQEKKPDQEATGAEAEPPSDVVPVIGPGTEWRVTSTNTEQGTTLTRHDHVAVFNEVPASPIYEIDLPFLSQKSMLDTRDADITPLLKDGYVADYGKMVIDEVFQGRMTLTKEGFKDFTIMMKGDERAITRILGNNQIRSSRIESAASIARESQSMNQELTEENLSILENSSANEKISVHTSRYIRSHIYPSPFNKAPTKPISLRLDNVNDSFTFPYGANGHWEFDVSDQTDEAGLAIPGSGTFNIGNIRQVNRLQTSLWVSEEGVNQRGESYIVLKSHNLDFSAKIFSRQGTTRFNRIVKDIRSQVAESNQRAYASHITDSSPFADEVFVANPMANSTYTLEDSFHPINIYSMHAKDGFVVNHFNHDAEISFDGGGGRQKSMQSVKVSDALYMSEIRLPEDNTRPYRAKFKNHANGKILTIKAAFQSSNDIAKRFAAAFRSALAKNEGQFSKDMVRLSTTQATAAAKTPENKDWAIQLWNSLSRQSQDRAIDFNNRRRQKSQFYVKRHYMPSSTEPPPFKILRDALLIEHDGAFPGEKGDIYWEGVQWRKGSELSEEEDLYRSYFVPGRDQRTVPSEWNWQATSRIDAAINNNHGSSIEFAVENDINEVKQYGAALNKKAQEFEQLALQVKTTHPKDAVAILLLVKWMTNEEIKGIDLILPSYSGHAVDRSKLIYNAFSKADASKLKTDHAARRKLILSLAYLLPESIQMSGWDDEPDIPPAKEPAEKKPAGSEPAPKVEDPKVEDPKVEAPKVEAPKVEAPKVEDPKIAAPKEPVANVPVAKQPEVRDPAVKDPAVQQPAPKAPRIIEIREKSSSDGGSGGGSLLGAILALVGGFLVMLGSAAYWLIKQSTSSAIGAVGEFMSLLGEGVTALLVPTLESAGGTGGAGANTLSATANAINELAEQHPDLLPHIDEDSMRKIHVVEFIGCGVLIIVEGSRTKESLEEVMDHPSAKRALDAIGNILVETGTAAACVGSGAGVAGENPAIYRYVSGSRIFNLARKYGNDLNLIAAILSFSGGSMSFRSEYMHEDIENDDDNDNDSDSSNEDDQAPAPVPAPIPAGHNPPPVEAKKPWWKVILQNLPGQGAP